MLDEVTAQQINDYQRDGFLAIPEFLTSSELRVWQRVTDQAVSDRLEAAGENTNQTEGDRSYYSRVFIQCLRLADTNDEMRGLIYDRRIGKMAAELTGIDGIRAWHDQALIKQAFGNPTAWHLDNPYWSFSSPDAISIWVALDDATLENGCMWYVPGSQKSAAYESPGIGQNISELFDFYPQWKEIDPVAVPASAGTAVFHGGLTAHAAGTNMTRHARRAMTCAFMPDGATFNGNQNILPQAYFESLSEGDVLDNEEQNPLIWSKSWE